MPDRKWILASNADVHAPAANTAAVVTYAAPERPLGHVISGVCWSYAGGDPTGGNLKIEDGGVTVFSMDITSAGAGFIPFDPPKRGSAGQPLVITLAAGGASVTGKLSIRSHWTE